MLKVLVVDDDSPIRRWLEYCVGQLEGFVLAGAAASGAQGLELYRKELPDIVITDIEMPGMSGLEMAARIQAIRPAHIIILTSHDNFSYARQALHSGTAEYILKTEVSLETMRDLLRRAAQTIQRAGGDAARQEQEAQAQALVRHLAMAEAQGPLTVQALRRQGITLEDAPLAAGDLWSRDGAGLAGARRLIGESQTMKNLRFVPVGYEHLLWIGNLGYEGALEDLARSFEKQGGELGCVLGLSTACPGLQGLPGLCGRPRPAAACTSTSRSGGRSCMTGTARSCCAGPRAPACSSAGNFLPSITGRRWRSRTRCCSASPTSAPPTWTR